MSNSNHNDDRNDQTRLFGEEAEKFLSPQGREYLAQDRKNRANDPCPRKTQRDNARLQCAAAYTTGVSIPQSVRIVLWECGLEDQEIDTWDRLRLIKRRGERFTPEQEQEYRRVRRLVDRCLSGRCDDDGDGDPPDDDGPDFDRSVGDDLADARAKRDAEAEPAPVIPQPEPAPVLPDLTPKAEGKRKPKPKPSARRGKDDRGRD